MVLSKLKLTLLENPDSNEEEQLEAQFWRFVESGMPDLPPESEDKRFLISAYIGDQYVGGLKANAYWDGLEIEVLWVDDDYRNQGIGRQLVMEAEKYAGTQGSVIAFLKTVEAVPFYESLGYSVYGTLEDRPVGTVLYHMKKRLDQDHAIS